jgi:hypothetical protein
MHGIHNKAMEQRLREKHGLSSVKFDDMVLNQELKRDSAW